MQQRVDPFVPIQRKPRSLTGQYGGQYFKKPETVTTPPSVSHIHRHSIAPTQRIVHRQTIDGLLQRPPTLQPPLPRKHLAPLSVPPRHETTGPKSERTLWLARMRRSIHATQLIIGIAAIIGISIGVQSLSISELAIGIYGITAIIRRIPSRTTFALTLLALICIVTSLFFEGGENTLSDNFVIYVFLLFGVGTLSLGIEAYHNRIQAS